MSEDLRQEVVSEGDEGNSSAPRENMASGGSKLFGGIAVVALFGAALAWFLGRSNDALPPNDIRPEPSKSGDAMMKPEEGVMTAGSYKDGTYSASGAYTSPAGPESVEVTLTLKDGAVTDVVFNGDSENEKSKFMQDKFGEGISAQVVGKSIDSLDLAVVNGSSLTPKGFMDALEKIKQEAKG